MTYIKSTEAHKALYSFESSNIINNLQCDYQVLPSIPNLQNVTKGKTRQWTFTDHDRVHSF